MCILSPAMEGQVMRPTPAVIALQKSASKNHHTKFLQTALCARGFRIRETALTALVTERV